MPLSQHCPFRQAF